MGILIIGEDSPPTRSFQVLGALARISWILVFGALTASVFGWSAWRVASPAPSVQEAEGLSVSLFPGASIREVWHSESLFGYEEQLRGLAATVRFVFGSDDYGPGGVTLEVTPPVASTPSQVAESLDRLGWDVASAHEWVSASRTGTSVTVMPLSGVGAGGSDPQSSDRFQLSVQRSQPQLVRLAVLAGTILGGLFGLFLCRMARNAPLVTQSTGRFLLSLCWLGVSLLVPSSLATYPLIMSALGNTTGAAPEAVWSIYTLWLLRLFTNIGAACLAIGLLGIAGLSWRRRTSGDTCDR